MALLLDDSITPGSVVQNLSDNEVYFFLHLTLFSLLESYRVAQKLVKLYVD